MMISMLSVVSHVYYKHLPGTDSPTHTRPAIAMPDQYPCMSQQSFERVRFGVVKL